MTHGCLVITSPEDARYVLLHTHHTAMDIPKWVKLSPRFTTVQQYKYLFLDKERPLWGKIKSREDCYEQLACVCGNDGFDYPPFVAAMIIACQPRTLKPIPPEYEKDLARWSGLDSPWRLEVASHEWKLFNEDGNLIDSFDPTEMMVDELWTLVQNARVKG